MPRDENTAIDIPTSWQRVAEQVVAQHSGRVMVIGASDRGKSTYCSVLASTLLRAGKTVAFVDADIGQKDVGPPATISLAYVQAGRSLTALPPESLYFVGAISPSAHFITMVIGTQRMEEQAKADCIIIDTTGHVTGKGKTLKSLLIEAVRPDLIIMLECDDELSALYRSHRHLNLLRLQASPLARGKSPSLRRKARQQAFRDYFSTANEVRFNVSELVFQRTLLFTGQPISNAGNLHTGQCEDGVLAVSKQEIILTERNLRVLPANFADQLLCGASDLRGECLGLATIRHIDFANDSVVLFTPVAKGAIKALQLGDIYLDAQGKELAHQRRGHF